MNTSQLSVEDAPLEQNEKNLYCDGTEYKIVKELEPSQVNHYSIPASHKAQTRKLNKTLGKKKKNQDDDYFPLNVGTNVADQEFDAENRDVRKNQLEQEFQSNIKRAVRAQTELNEAMTK